MIQVVATFLVVTVFLGVNPMVLFLVVPPALIAGVIAALPLWLVLGNLSAPHSRLRSVALGVFLIIVMSAVSWALWIFWGIVARLASLKFDVP